MGHAEPVTLEACKKFLKKHQTDTWLAPWIRQKLGLDYGTTFKIKYINFHFDTRDWRVWKITGRGFVEHFEASTYDEFDGTILDLLTHKLKLIPKEGTKNELCQNRKEAVSSGTASKNKPDKESAKRN